MRRRRAVLALGAVVLAGFACAGGAGSDPPPGGARAGRPSGPQLGDVCDAEAVSMVCSGAEILGCMDGRLSALTTCGDASNETGRCQPGHTVDGRATASCECAPGTAICGDGGMRMSCVDGEYGGLELCRDGCREDRPGAAVCIGGVRPAAR